MRLRNGVSGLLLAVGLGSFSAAAQTALTGAMNFSANASGAASGGQSWNTLGGDHLFNLWLASDAQFTLPVNGPADAQAGINLPLQAGQTYTFYMCGQPGDSTGFNGLNLFFGGNAAPGISVFGPTNSSLFTADASTTSNLQGAPALGSGRRFYSSGGVTVALIEYTWHSPGQTSPDVCQNYAFAPGGGPDFFGSFTLQTAVAANLAVTPSTATPGTPITISGSAFTPLEKVYIYTGQIGAKPLYATDTDASGKFALAAQVALAPNGPEEYIAVGQSSGIIGTAAAFVSAGLILSPQGGLPGSAVTVDGAGFGAGEIVNIYWNNPRQLSGTATADGTGSFVGANGATITIPANAPIGINDVIGAGQTTKAVGLGKIVVR
jgi:hypothetical protein